MLNDSLANLFMHRLDYIKAAVFLKGFGKNFLEGHFLFAGGHGNFGFENGTDEFFLGHIGILGIEKSIIDVGGSVVKTREHKAEFRSGNGLGEGAVVESALVNYVAELGFAFVNGANGTDEIVEYAFGSIFNGKFVGAFKRNVIMVRAQKDYVVAVKVDRRDYFFIKLIAKSRVANILAYLHKELVFLAFHNLLGGKFDIDKVFSKGTGKGFFKKRHISFPFGLGHCCNRFFNICDDFFKLVYKTAVNLADAVFIKGKAAADLVKFFLVH
jgi:hypothetical protein